METTDFCPNCGELLAIDIKEKIIAGKPNVRCEECNCILQPVPDTTEVMVVDNENENEGV